MTCTSISADGRRVIATGRAGRWHGGVTGEAGRWPREPWTRSGSVNILMRRQLSPSA
ncbi:MAG: hypothetical protein U5L11_10520 [Arhodomonas sp.]|nr:hypothetical protein [Arhodomonas sp.]